MRVSLIFRELPEIGRKISSKTYHFLPKFWNLPDLNEEFPYIFYTFLINFPEMKGKSPWCPLETYQMHGFLKHISAKTWRGVFSCTTEWISTQNSPHSKANNWATSWKIMEKYPSFLHKYLCLTPLSNWPEAVLKRQKPCSNYGIHVLFEHVFLHDITRQNLAAQNEHFVYAYIDVNIISRNDVFDLRICKPMPFCTTSFNIQNMTFWHFRCNFRLESGQMQR